MDFESDKITLNFFKPGFDLALILSDKTLFYQLTSMQKYFQSSLGLITHCILLSNEQRLPLLIKELKLKEIHYAIYIQTHSADRNEFDLYVLYPYIEVQQLMTFKDMFKMIIEDMRVQQESIHTILESLGDPHKKHNTNERFVTMSNDIRYFLCLLFDGRMVSIEELQAVKNYLLVRRKKMEYIQSTNMRCNDITESPRQQNLENFFYDPRNAGPNPAIFPGHSIAPNSTIASNRSPHHLPSLKILTDRFSEAQLSKDDIYCNQKYIQYQPEMLPISGFVAKQKKEMRFDSVGHWIRSGERKRRCQVCPQRSRTFCSKCNVPLCVDCFEIYHSRN